MRHILKGVSLDTLDGYAELTDSQKKELEGSR
jgi:hypothetical protein